MALTDGNRRETWAEFMRRASNDREALPLTKDDLRLAVNAIDDWIDLNAASLNLFIPEPARSALTARQKAALFMNVVARRFEVS